MAGGNPLQAHIFHHSRWTPLRSQRSRNGCGKALSSPAVREEMERWNWWSPLSLCLLRGRTSGTSYLLRAAEGSPPAHQEQAKNVANVNSNVTPSQRPEPDTERRRKWSKWSMRSKVFRESFRDLACERLSRTLLPRRLTPSTSAQSYTISPPLPLSQVAIVPRVRPLIGRITSIARRPASPIDAAHNLTPSSDLVVKQVMSQATSPPFRIMILCQ